MTITTTPPFIQLMKLIRFHDCKHLQKNAKSVISYPGTISEESSKMNFPALNIREAHKRPEAIEEASVMMVGLNVIHNNLQLYKNQQSCR